jgi:hypothetical protein
MPTFEAGSYVMHSKMPDLGSGEVLSLEKGTMRIRFASGERAFAVEKVEAHLSVTQEAPAKPTAASKRAAKKKAATKAKA